MKNSINRLLIASALVFSIISCQSKTDSTENTIPLQIKEEVSIPKDTSFSKETTKHTIVIEQMQFNPAELTIHKGDTVVWINKGIVEHDISEFPNKTWTSGTLKIGASWQKIPTASFNYFCSIHMTMKGSIKVID
jgi:plastocyanin